MMVTLSCVVNPDGVTLSEALEKSAGYPVLKQGFMMVIVDEHDRLQAILTLQSDDGRQWTREGTCFWHQHRRDSRDITTAETIKLSQVANTMTELVWLDKSFI